MGCDKISSWYDSVTQKDTHKTAPVSPSPILPTETPIAAELPKNVVARVGSWNMTIDDFNERLGKLKGVLPEFDSSNLDSKKLILEELIRQQLLVMDAERTGLAQKKEIVDTVDDFRKTLIVQELANSLTKDIQATDADALDFYNKNQKSFITKAEWKIRDIVVPDESEAKDILVQLLQGADFAETAKTRSKASTADKGGDLGFLSKFPSEQMKSAVAPLEIGKVSGVFKASDGYHIVKLDDKRGGQPQNFEAVKQEILKGLTLRKQQEAVLEYLNKLAGKTRIQVNDELLK
jgi:peptidyl-prolyl cis-trans isomerase C